MRVNKSVFCLVTMAITFFSANAQTLHYNRPATFFEEALVIGNGRLGGIIYGGTNQDRISLNDITLWTGEPDLKPVNPDAHKHLADVRRALDNEDYAAADTLVRRMQGHESEKYQPLGTLYIDYLDKEARIDKYQRSLSLATATAYTTYLRNSNKFRTEYFASSPDSVIVVKISSEGKEGINARVRLDCILAHEISVENNRIINSGYAAYTANSFYETGKHGEKFFYDPKRGIHFRTIVEAKHRGGSIIAEDGALLIKGCREVVLFIANSTSFNGAEKDPVKEGLDYKTEVMRNINKAARKGFNDIRKSQLKDYQALFNRVSLNLGTTADNIKSLPTDVQLRNYSLNNEYNPELEALYFQFGRYLLISSSRTPEVPANLQGLWNEHLSAPWRSNYTININLEENYWAAETTNLSEMHQSLLTFVKAMERTGRQSAKAYYDIDKGWCAAHNSDIWAITNPIGEGISSPQWANWTMGGAWLSTHIWEHYSFSRNTEFLKQYYPTLKGAAEFCMEWLVEKDGELITSFSTSPENRYITTTGFRGDTFYGGSADLAIIRECVGDAVKAAQVLGVDNDFIGRAENIISRLRPYKIGKRGQLLEWYHDWDDDDWQHRHQSHLIGLYPGHHITPALTSDLAKAAARSLEIKGDKTTGWSTGWRINLLARLNDNKGAYHMIRTLLKYVSPDKYEGPDKQHGGGTYPNLLDAHSPFQIDGNFGGCAGIAEMLIQSSQNNITLLPACPDEWKKGRVSGLCARGGFTLDFSWNNGKITKVTIKAKHAASTTLHINGKEYNVSLKQGQSLKINI